MEGGIERGRERERAEVAAGRSVPQVSSLERCCQDVTLHLTVEGAGQDETPSGSGPSYSFVLATLGGVIPHRSCW